MKEYHAQQLIFRDHPSSTYAKFTEKTNIFYPLIRTRTSAYQGVRKVSLSENFALHTEWMTPYKNIENNLSY